MGNAGVDVDADPDASMCSDFTGQVPTPRRAFIRTEAGSAGILVAAALLALLWANSPWSGSYESLLHTRLELRLGSYELGLDLHHWINDGLMAVFFFVIGLEVRREFAIGELTERSRLVIPLVAGVGGMLVPVLFFLLWSPGGEAARGWGVVIGTDTAFLLGALAIVGPSVSTQLRVFLLTLTVIDDVVAVSVIGLVYSDELTLTPLVVAGACVAVLAALGYLGVWRAAPYVVTVLLLWFATLESGLHASIAGMVAGLMVPAAEPSRRLVESAARQFRAFRESPMPGVQRSARKSLNRAISVNERLQEVLHGWTSHLVVPVFALANAGIDLRGGVLGDALSSRLTWGVVTGLVLGKFIGIGLGALGAERLGWGRLPQGVGSGHILAGGALSGIGFTVSMLIVALAFDTERLRGQALVGVLIAAVLAAVLGWAVFGFAARFLGQTDAALPRILSDPVDPARDHIRGPAEAPLTLVEYLDFECPFCARATGVAAEVRRHFGDRLRYVPRHLPLPVHPHAELAALAVEAAARQDSYWEMHTKLFENHEELELADLIGYAADLGLDAERFVRDLDDEDLARHLQRDIASAEASGVRGTPTFFVGEVRHVGPHDAVSLIAALEDGAGRQPGVFKRTAGG